MVPLPSLDQQLLILIVEGTMHTAFFARYGSFSHHNIGGTDSIVRRLSYDLAARDHRTEFVTFRAPLQMESKGQGGVPVCDFIQLDDALDYIKDKFDNVITIYLPPKERIKYAAFRRKECNRIRFHREYEAWPESFFRRELSFAEAHIAPYNGLVICVSPRLQRYWAKRSKNTTLLWPSVPDDFFIKPEEKSCSDKLRVAFMGRLEPGKGTSIAYDFFRYLAKCQPNIETAIYGYPWSRNPETIRFHETLTNQKIIPYESTQYEGYSPEVDKAICQRLREVDVLFLPYTRLSSTIDTPLVLLEGMAHLCAVMLPPLGDLPFIYGTTKYLIKDLMDFAEMEKTLLKIWDNLNEERARIYAQSADLGFHTTKVVDKLLRSVNLLI